MDKHIYIRELIDEYGTSAWEVLDNYGVELDDWDMRLTLDALCDDYDLNLKEILHALLTACERDGDDYVGNDESDDDEFSMYDDEPFDYDTGRRASRAS